MRAGVGVKAAAAGKILNTRDELPDRIYVAADAAAIAGRDCGNGVVIDHGAGWRTIYCHMLKGSITVKQGQEVGAGAHLGYVGMSGKAEFPHLHFGVMQDGKKLDPFLDPNDEPASCRPAPGQSLWLPEAAAALAYSPLDLVMIGSTDSAANGRAMLTGEQPSQSEIARTAPALVAWVILAGTEPGDRLALRLICPSGNVVAQANQTFEKRRARDMVYTGLRRRPQPWPAGTYRITAEVRRGDGEAALRRSNSSSFTVR
jgi:hypothetical protein